MTRSDVKQEGTGRRRYVSPKRERAARETRRRIRSAATQLFLDGGYQRTTMVAIARAAGVAEKTVYLAFPSKSDLLLEIIQVAVRDGEEAPSLAGRAEWAAMLAAPGEEILRRFAELSGAIFERTASVLAVAEAAAPDDPALAAHAARGHENMRSDFRAVAASLARRGVLRPGLSEAEAADVIFALVGHDPYLRLRRECGWSRDAYVAWLRATLEAVLVGPHAAN